MNIDYQLKEKELKKEKEFLEKYACYHGKDVRTSIEQFALIERQELSDTEN